MSAPSALQVLQLLAFKRQLDAGALAGATGWPTDAVHLVLEQLENDGSVTVEGGPHSLTPEGRERLDELGAAERATLDLPAIGACYERFERANTKLKSVITAWQLREGPDGELVPNDHGDAEYDDQVRERLAKLDESFHPVLEDLIALVPRWDVYRHRFDVAIAQVDGGDNRYIASPLLDSYHTVWFELHEELLRVQDLDRLAEEAV